MDIFVWSSIKDEDMLFGVIVTTSLTSNQGYVFTRIIVDAGGKLKRHKLFALPPQICIIGCSVSTLKT